MSEQNYLKAGALPRWMERVIEVDSRIEQERLRLAAAYRDHRRGPVDPGRVGALNGSMRIALGVAVALVLSAAPAEAAGYHPTHRVTLDAHFVDHWTIDDPDECGPVGGGTVTVDVRSRTPNRAQVVITRFHSSETGDGKGSWTLLNIVDAFGHIGDMHAKPGRGTINRSDETQPRPREVVDVDGDGVPDSEPCNPPDRTGCGVNRLKKPMVAIQGYDSKRILVDVPGPQWMQLPCRIGSLDLFSSPPALAGGNARGELLLKMPRASKLRRQKVVIVRGSSRKVTHTGDPGSAAYTDDVSRTATVTFTRIR